MKPAIVQTYSGKMLDLRNPDPEDIMLEDIAHALSQICRFTGHTRAFYSVAQHSALVADIVPNEHKIAGLMHDAQEAYIQDVSKPLKNLLTTYHEIEDRVWRCICSRFNIQPELPEIVKYADMTLVITEMRDLLPVFTIDGKTIHNSNEHPPLPQHIRPWPVSTAKRVFLEYAFEIGLKEGK